MHLCLTRPRALACLRALSGQAECCNHPVFPSQDSVSSVSIDSFQPSNLNAYEH
jgi:hypothetical protein